MTILRPLTPTATPPPSGRLIVSLWGPVVAYMTAIFVLSSMTSLPEPPGRIGDKSVHLLEYAGLALVTLRALSAGRLGDVRLPVAVGTLAIALAYGLTDEIHQLFVPGRLFDVRDLAADAIGAGTATAAVWTWGIIRRSSGSASRRG